MYFVYKKDMNFERPEDKRYGLIVYPPNSYVETLTLIPWNVTLFGL